MQSQKSTITTDNSFELHYDGAQYCSQCANCPIIEVNKSQNLVRISDPAKPQNGVYTMTVEEYNTILANAKEVK